MAERNRSRTVAVIVAHPDDEALGAGGTMAVHARRGDTVHPIFLADGVGARGQDAAAAEKRAQAGRLAASALGAGPPRFLGFPDNRLDTVALLEIIQSIEQIIAAIRPDTVYTHHQGDLNIDHAICHRAVLTACRPLPQCTVRRIYAMEVLSSTEWGSPSAVHGFTPTHFVDVTTTAAAKRRALEAYVEEMRDFPHARSFEAVEALMKIRGAAVGLGAAEAFAVLRQIED